MRYSRGVGQILDENRDRWIEEIHAEYDPKLEAIEKLEECLESNDLAEASRLYCEAMEEYFPEPVTLNEVHACAQEELKRLRDEVSGYDEEQLLLEKALEVADYEALIRESWYY